MFALRAVRQRQAARLLNSSSSLASQSRSIHHVPQLDNGKTWKEQGIGKLMSPEQYDIAWKQNQERLVDNLNRLTDGGPYENSTTKSILLQTARNPDQAPHFNYASLAHNNHFFFSGLSNTPTRPSSTFGQELVDCFSSPASFRAAFLATAEAMFGPGYVWLVQTPKLTPAKYAILCTYQAGSPYPGAAFRKQDKDMANTDNHLRRGLSGSEWKFMGGARRPEDVIAPGGETVTPLLCVSTWEHTYLHDYGVAGKRNYLEKWWDHIDWSAVEAKKVAEGRNGAIPLMNSQSYRQTNDQAQWS